MTIEHKCGFYPPEAYAPLPWVGGALRAAEAAGSCPQCALASVLQEKSKRLSLFLLVALPLLLGAAAGPSWAAVHLPQPWAMVVGSLLAGSAMLTALGPYTRLHELRERAGARAALQPLTAAPEVSAACAASRRVGEVGYERIHRKLSEAAPQELARARELALEREALLAAEAAHQAVLSAGELTRLRGAREAASEQLLALWEAAWSRREELERIVEASPLLASVLAAPEAAAYPLEPLEAPQGAYPLYKPALPAPRAGF